MDFRQLETFVQVVQSKSFSKAAEELFITQPTVTNHIKNLEEEVGTLLINRMGKKISLTNAGEILYNEALDIINSLQMIKHELSMYNNEIKGHLDIVSSSVPRKHLIPSIIDAFLKEHANVTFSISNDDSQEVVNSILDSYTDFGFIGEKYPNPNLEYINIISDKLVLIASKDFKPETNKQGEISVKSILDGKFIFREVGSASRNIFVSEFEKQDISLSQLKPVAYVRDVDTIKKMVSLGIGFSFISEKLIEDDLKLNKFKAYNVKGIDLSRNYYFVYHKNRQLSPLGETFKNFILKRIDNLTF